MCCAVSLLIKQVAGRLAWLVSNCPLLAARPPWCHRGVTASGGSLHSAGIWGRQ